ncbi:succinate dehydrogenase, cytochrome b556 subunit [Planctobacterium marinum]|uniref:succinate dehydrogenase, cytochrome b556 subunit n=1 Tax=Planctobacterium marinum TaxID=1631968 RepID=UPI001E54EE7A|nr:succinate dehydrogenase, cytochrome b556 subunit [Planctobacterium marinum]MCC2607450.1 succinate dehydrogenase, cytochrome b556 subunit [Planctobacterium marinum]
MKKNRPKNMDLTTIQLPVMGLASILHRISAVIVWFAFAFFLAGLHLSLSSSDGLTQVKDMLSNHFIVQFLTWGFLTALGYYVVAGLKHIIQEFGYCESLRGGRIISQVAIAAGLVLSVLSGLWVWG